MTKLYENPKWLRYHYVTLGKPITELAELADSAMSTISRKLDKYDIEARDSGIGVADERLKDRDWLYEQYVEKERSMKEIARQSPSAYPTVRDHVIKYGFEIRQAGGGETPFSQLADYDWVYNHYVENNESISEIADIIGCSTTPVWNALQRHNIRTRKKEMPSGEDHPNWKGGNIEYYGSSWTCQRELALERAEYECEHTGISQQEHIDKYGMELHVHHIVPFREYGVGNHERANRLDNLRVLSCSEHRKWEVIPVVPEVKR